MYLLKGNAPVPTQTLYESTLVPNHTRSCPVRPILHPHRTFSRYHRALTDCDSRGGYGHGHDGDDDDAWNDARRQSSAIGYSRRYFHHSSRHYHLAKSGDLNCGNGCDVVHDGGNALRLSPPCVYRINESAPHANALLVNGERDSPTCDVSFPTCWHQSHQLLLHLSYPKRLLRVHDPKSHLLQLQLMSRRDLFPCPRLALPTPADRARGQRRHTRPGLRAGHDVRRTSYGGIPGHNSHPGGVVRTVAEPCKARYQ